MSLYSGHPPILGNRLPQKMDHYPALTSKLDPQPRRVVYLHWVAVVNGLRASLASVYLVGHEYLAVCVP